MKKTVIVALIVAGALIISGVVMVVIGLSSRPVWTWNVPKTEINPVTVEITEDFDELWVEEISGDILLAASDDGKCRVESWETEHQKLNTKLVNGRLYIERENHEGWKTIFSGEMDFDGHKTVVYLPKDAYDRVHLETTSGEIRAAEKFTLGDVYLHSTSGEIELANAAAGEVNISATSGDLFLSDITAGGVLVSATSGSISIAKATCGSLEMKTTSGDFSVNDVAADSSVKAKTTSGDISFDRLKGEEIAMETTSGDIKGSIVGPMLRYESETTSGDIKVPDAQENGGSFRAKTTSGDIEISEINE